MGPRGAQLMRVPTVLGGALLCPPASSLWRGGPGGESHAGNSCKRPSSAFGRHPAVTSCGGFGGLGWWRDGSWVLRYAPVLFFFFLPHPHSWRWGREVRVNHIIRNRSRSCSACRGWEDNQSLPQATQGPPALEPRRIPERNEGSACAQSKCVCV